MIFKRTGDKARIAALENIAQGIYAEIYLAAGSAAQTIPTGSTYTKVTAFATNGLSRGCTADAANDKITVTRAGKYKVTATFSSKLGTSDVLWDTAVFVGGVEASNVHMRRKFSTTGYTFSVALDGIVNVAANTDIDIRSKHDNASGINITVEYANFNIHYIGV